MFTVTALPEYREEDEILNTSLSTKFNNGTLYFDRKDIDELIEQLTIFKNR